MTFNKHNINDVLHNILREKKIKYNQNDDGLYEIFVSSIEGFIQVEPSSNDDSVTLQFFSEIDNDGNSLHHSILDSDSSEYESLDGEIDSLVNTLKDITIGLNKINTKIEQIKSICEEYNLDPDRFITVEFDFDSL